MTLGVGVEQLYIFAVFLVLGVTFCAIYIFGCGIFRAKVAYMVFDCTFGAVAVYAVWKVNLEVNNGEFRLYMLLALALGCVVTYFMCKSTLDKLSSLLYNLFTTLRDDSDGTDFSKQEIVNTDSGSHLGGGSTGMHVVGNTHPNVIAQPADGSTKPANSGCRTRFRKNARTARLHQLKRVRKTVGRRKRKT